MNVCFSQYYNKRFKARVIGIYDVHGICENIFGWYGDLRVAACKNRELHFSDHLVEFCLK